MIRYFLSIFLILFAFGCAHNPPSVSDQNLNDEQMKNAGLEIDRFRVNEVSKTPEIGVEKAEELEMIPTEINPSVEKWINYFQGRGRPHMERYLLRSTRYEALMKKVLRDNKLPEDLFYIALIESGFSSSAHSHASAVGYWQFIRGTGKRYKLKINKLVDERRDPVLSTQAASEYFRDLYSRFNSWYLSMAAYNVGEGRVERVIKKYKTRDFWKLAKIHRALPAETDNYVPKFIAAKLIAKNPDKYGFEGIDYMPPIEFDHVVLDQPVNLRLMAEKMNINYEDFKDLNPKFKGEIAPLDEGKSFGLRIPPGTYEAALLAAKESVAEEEVFIADRNEFQNYRVKRGETLATIARKYRTNVAYLRDINDFPRKKKIKVGQRILVPDRTPLIEKRPQLAAKSNKKKSKSTAVSKTDSRSSQEDKKYHIVRKGENLSQIARKYEITVSSLKRANNLKSKSKLKLGTKLVIPTNAKL